MNYDEFKAEADHTSEALRQETQQLDSKIQEVESKAEEMVHPHHGKESAAAEKQAEGSKKDDEEAVGNDDGWASEQEYDDTDEATEATSPKAPTKVLKSKPMRTTPARRRNSVRRCQRIPRLIIVDPNSASNPPFSSPSAAGSLRGRLARSDMAGPSERSSSLSSIPLHLRVRQGDHRRRDSSPARSIRFFDEVEGQRSGAATPRSPHDISTSSHSHGSGGHEDMEGSGESEAGPKST